MNITVSGKNRVEAELSEEELALYGITYDELDYGNVETRRVLWTLLDDIKKRYDVGIALSGRLLIEAIKETKNIYRICFTSLSPKEDRPSLKQLIKCPNPPVVAEFMCFEDIVSAVRNISEEYESDLYEKDGKYRLVFRIPSDSKTLLCDRICEFSDIKENPETENAVCSEHWHCLMSGNALSLLRHYFLRDSMALFLSPLKT